MIRRLRLAWWLLLVPLAALPTRAQPTTLEASTRPSLDAATYGNCLPGSATADLSVGGTRARLYNTGGLFWRGGASTYEVPKDSGIQAIRAAGIWVGGTVGGQLRFAGADYADWEWWPGPLDADAQPPADCAPFDRIWTATRQRDGAVTGDVATWPAHLGAPFNDADGDGVYEPEAGETPTVYGHQTAFWVMNDRGGPHAWSGTAPLGLTVRVTAHSFAVTRPALGFGTFYRYTFENPNAYAVEEARFGFWTDADLGDFTDDYMGSDPARGLAFVYNSDDVDAGSYGERPPAIGVDILSGAAGAFYYEDDTSVRGVPPSGEAAYGYLNFRFQDGTPLTVGGTGYNPDQPTAEPTTWQWPGAPEQLAYWSEFDLDGAGTANGSLDRRFVAVATPFRLAAGASHTVDVAVLWGRGVSFLDSVTKLRSYSDQVQALYDEGTLFNVGGARSGAPLYEPERPLTTLATPAPTFPANGADLEDVPLPRTDPDCTPDDRDRECTEVRLTWDAVPDAVFYEVQVGPTLDLSGAPSTMTRQPTLLNTAYSDEGPQDIYWRVRARTATELSRYSDVQRYTTRFYVPAFRDGGIVEVAYADTLTCGHTPTAPGCGAYGGATVWQIPSPNADYYVTSLSGELDPLETHIDVAAPHDYALRFSEACAAARCYGIDYQPDGVGRVVTVPFELWQIGVNTPGIADDDVRMIPFLRQTSTNPPERWRYAALPNPGNGDNVDSPADFTAPISDAIYWMYPDRADGYARLADAAAQTDLGAPLLDTDEQIDLDPSTGTPCERQGFFVDFCHRNDLIPGGDGATDFVSLISSMVFADQAGDGVPPAPGTVIRLFTSKSAPLIDDTPPPGNNNEVDDPSPGIPEVITLDVFPNPASSLVTVRYSQVGRLGATLKVYDMLGQLVAELDAGVREPGIYQQSFDVSSLAGGIYWVVFRSVNARAVRPISVVR